MLELRDGSCYEKPLVGVNVVLAFVDALIALIAFYQVLPLSFSFYIFKLFVYNLYQECSITVCFGYFRVL